MLNSFFSRTLSVPFLALSMLLLGSTALGQSQTQHTKLDLFAEVTSVAEESTFSIGISLDPDPGWHVYWVNPGDNGNQPKANWTLPEGFEAGELQYTTPSLVPFQEYMSYGYDDKTLFITDITPPSEFDGPVKIECLVRWLVCDDSVCVPERGTVSVSIPKGSGQNMSTWHADFETARTKHPQRVDWKAEFVATEETVELEVHVPEDAGEISDVWFFPAAQKLINHGQPQVISVSNSVIRIKSTAGVRFDRYDEIVGVLRTIPSSTKEKSQSFEVRAVRVPQLAERDLGEPNSRSPSDIKALTVVH